MKKNSTYVVIMAGGIGSRFWPISRTDFPKQFLDILGTGQTLIQQTFNRFTGLVPAENIYVVTADEYVDIVKTQLPLIPTENILGENYRKNTAPCVAFISFKLLLKDADASIIVAPSDHLILDEAGFLNVCNTGIEFINNNDALLTLGMRPTYANTGYGYIQREAAPVSDGIYEVKQFTEKPELEKARAFIASGDYLWNSGIFLWRAESILNAFKKYLPEVYELFALCMDAYNTPAEKQAIDAAYEVAPAVSIDFGIMEKAPNVFTMPASFGWSDLGTWTSAWENMEKDEMANAVSGNRVVVIDAAKCVVHAPVKKLVVLQGLQDYIIVDTKDALLICQKEKEQDIKQYVAEVTKRVGNEYMYVNNNINIFQQDIVSAEILNN